MRSTEIDIDEAFMLDAEAKFPGGPDIMRVMEFVETDGILRLRSAARAVPEPAPGEILIQVCAAGVTTTEKIWYPTTHKSDGSPRTAAIPGHEFSGIVAALGDGASSYKIGDAVFGMNDWFAEGASAEFCITKPENIAPKPASLSHVEAAAVPICALTAWQGLHFRAKLQPGERLLIHGGAGAVGLFAVQLARLHGAQIVATISAAHAETVRGLGANEVIDYHHESFEDVAGQVDVVFDTVGGATLERSWRLLKPGGRLVTIAADVEASNEPRIKEAFFIVEPDGEQLASIANLFNSSILRAFVKVELPLNQADHAYEGAPAQARNLGKVVLRI